MSSRADELLVKNALVPSRARARAVIEEGLAFADGVRIDKPSRKIAENAKLEIADGSKFLRYVSRAGLKLEHALDAFDMDVSGLVALDAGASTGGFTHCLLMRGAKKCVCADVGTGQLHPMIAGDCRVVNMEKCDVRTLTPKTFDGKLFDFICADLSFISLEKVFGVLWNLLARGGNIVCLVKPQFEASRSDLRGTGGVIKDEAKARACLARTEAFVAGNFPDAQFVGDTESPIRGGDGNREYLAAWRKA